MDICKFPGGDFELKIYENQDAFDKGIVKDIFRSKNKMTNASLAVISGLVGNVGSQIAFGWIELGTDATAVSAAHTALQVPITADGLARVAATPSRTTTTQTNDTLSLVASWTASASYTIREIGIFNASSAGVMLCRALTTNKAVVSTNIVTATYTWQVVGN